MFLRDWLCSAVLAAAFLCGTGWARAQNLDSEWLEDDDAEPDGNEEVESAGSDALDAPAPEREVPPPPPPRGAEDLDGEDERQPVRVFEPEGIDEAAPETYSGEPTESDSDEPEGTAEADDEAPPRRPYTGPPSLFGGDTPIAYGGYGGVDVRWSRIAGHDAVLVGGEGALLLDHRLAIGFGGYGLSTLVPGPRSSDGNRSYVGMGYGGLVVRHNFVNERLVYLSVGTLVGAGGVGFIEQVEEYEYEFDESEFDSDAFLVVEPSLGLHLNVTRWMRVGASVAYRYTKGINCEGFEDRDFRGPSAGGQVQFGWF